MNLETVSSKHINELEILVKELLAAMRKANLEKDSLGENLRQFNQELEDTRRQRFDNQHPEYKIF